MPNQPGSKRWTHFYDALQLAVQRSAHKWTYEDFEGCFPLYVEEAKDGSNAVFNTISSHMESQMAEDLNELFKEYNVKENIDILHALINEAVARKDSGKIGKDVWNESLPPRVAVCARTVPILQQEAADLKATLAALEEENAQMQTRLQEDVNACEEADGQALELLARIDKIRDAWLKLPMEEIEGWTIQMAESTKPTRPL